MKRTLMIITLFVNLFGFAGAPRAEQPYYFTAPAGTLPAQINTKKDVFVLPNGRLLTPWGKQLMLTPHPYGLAVSHDGKTAAALQTTNKPNFVCIVKDLDTKKPRVVRLQTESSSLTSAFMGLAFSNDDKLLYVSTGNDGGVAVVDVEAMKVVKTLSLNGTFGADTFADGYTGDIVLSPDGKTLYAIDQLNFRVAAIDAASLEVKTNYRVGRYPFGLALSPDGNRLYVVNSGMFEYSLVDGFNPGNPKRTSLTFPPFGFPSDEARDGVTVGKIHVPGLGDPNVPESFSLWALDISNPADAKVVYKVKTGPLSGEIVNGYKAVGGSSPTAVLATADTVYVANEHTDNIAVFDAASGELKQHVSLIPAPELGALKGVMPFGMSLSPDRARLYVAEAGINAVAVIDTAALTVLGHIPAGWFPSMVRVTADGRRLFVANAKGYGSGPNAGSKFIMGVDGTYVGRLMKGTLSIISLPVDERLKEGTELVLKNNGFIPVVEETRLTPVARAPGAASDEIKYVVFITKENRTFDEMFGDLKYDDGQMVEGLADLARFGMDATVINDAIGKRYEHVAITPNHHALAYEFGTSDNFYMDSDVSADGHRWLVGVYPNEWVETNTSASYSGNRDKRLGSTAPGRISIGGSDASVEPEDYLEAGGIWEHFERNGVSFRNWGEGFELAGAQEFEGLEPTGVRLPLNMPMPKPLFDNTSRDYPTFNMGVSDKYRADQFIKEFTDTYIDSSEPLPSFMNIYLPNDHCAGERPDAGYPFTASYVADNDLALGRIVEFLSHTKYWPNMVIFVTEDDPQGGVDHVDAHRSILLAIGPYVKRGHVSHDHTSIVSIIKTINLIFGLPSLNQYDAAAADLTDFFTDTPDFTPYTLKPVDPRVFDPEKVKTGGGIYKYMSTPLDDPETIEREHWQRIEDEKNGG